MADELITIEIRGLPVDLQGQARQHGDELTRELMLVAEQMRRRGEAGLPGRFVELVETVTNRFSVFTAEQEQQLAEAVAAGTATLDLSYRVPASVAEAARSLGDIFDEVDDYCRDGQLLLTLETPPHLVLYRRWFLDQFVDQAAGRPPVAWADYVPARG